MVDLGPSSISVVIATRNSERFLNQCLTSVYAQTIQPLEILVIDAQSTDATVSIVENFPGTAIYSQTGSGLPQAWNQGIALSSGTFLAFIDSDDYWECRCLEMHLRAISQSRQFGISGGRVRYFLDGSTHPGSFRESLLQGTHHGSMPGSTLFRRNVFQSVGKFPEDSRVVSDLDWFSQFRESSMHEVRIEELVLNKRVHNSNLSYNSMRTGIYETELLHMLKEKIQRARTHES